MPRGGTLEMPDKPFTTSQAFLHPTCRTHTHRHTDTHTPFPLLTLG